MAKRRRRRSRAERGTRAKPQRIKAIQRLEPVKEVPIKTTTYRILGPRTVFKPKVKPLAMALKNIIHTPSCQAKKADARHNYFSMRKSGKGASRTNPISDRFNSRCK